MMILVPSFLLFKRLLGEKSIYLQAKSFYKIGKSTFIFCIKQEMPTQAGNKHLSILFILKGRVFLHLLTENGQKWTSKCFFWRRHNIHYKNSLSELSMSGISQK